MWFDLQKDFYKPLWIRLSIVVVCFGWAVLEFFNGGGLWAALFAFLGAVSLQQFFLDGWPASEDSVSDNKTIEHKANESESTNSVKANSKSPENDENTLRQQ